MTGGSTVFFLASYSYISDISDPKKRTTRMAYMDGLFPLGFYIGNALAGPVTKYLGFGYNFSLGMLCSCLAAAYVVFFVKDSRIARDARIKKDLEDQIMEMKLKKNTKGMCTICRTGVVFG